VTIGSAAISEAELETIDDVTAGTVAASKAVVVDSNKDIGSFRNVTLTGELDAATLDISGDADIDGTLEADAITIGGTAINTVIAGVTVTNATTAAVATTVTISDNESTNEDNAIVFTSGGDVDGGNIGLESDGDLTYNPSTGRLTATQLAGTLQTAAQANITSLGTLTTLTVDNVIINGTTIGHTDDTDLITLADGIATVAGEISVTTLDIGGTNVAATAAELNIMDGGTSASSTTVVDADRVVFNDNGTMKQVAMTDISAYTDAGATALAIALG
jgi:cytoskeletal protein CcmA (bactofilin family)